MVFPAPRFQVGSLKRIAIHKLATIPGGILKIPVKECSLVFQYLKDETLVKSYYTDNLSGMSLREVENLCGIKGFVHVLSRILDYKEAFLKLQVYLSSYASDKLWFADHLYMFGLGDLMVQGYLKWSPKMQFYRLLSSTWTSLPNLYAILPKVRHSPKCDMSVGFHLANLPEEDTITPLIEVMPASVFKFLSNLIVCRMNQRWFEAWVFGLSALDAARENKGRQDELFIAALELSLCSVNIGMPHSLTSKLEHLAESMRFSNPMYCLHWALTKSRICVASGKFKEETSFFQKYLPRFHRTSLLRNQFLESHIRGQLELVENHFVWCFINSYMKCEERLNRSWGKEMCRDIEVNLDLMDPPQGSLGRYLRGRLYMMRACFEEDSDQREEFLSIAKCDFGEAVCSLDVGLRVTESEVLAEYLSHPHKVPFLILDKFQAITKSFYSRVHAETLVRIFVTNKFALNKINDGNIPLYSLYEHYTTATLNGGYRVSMLRLLRHTAEEDRRVPTLLTELPNRKSMYAVISEYIDSDASTESEDDEDDVPKSKGLLHHCFVSEQAWCIGSTRCQNSVKQT